MGRYYSRIDGDLYIYVTKNDPMADLSLFPPELELFDHAEPRRVNGKMAIVKGAAEINVDKAEIILSLNGFKERDLPREVLEHYYDSGDEAILDDEPLSEREVEAREDEKAVSGEVVEVIIPRAKSPTLGYGAGGREDEKGESRAKPDGKRRSREPSPEGGGVDQDRVPASEEELIDSLVLWMRSQGIQIEKEREPLEIEPSAQAPNRATQESFTSGELAEMLSEALRSETGQRPAPEARPPVDDLFRQMTAYVRSITPRPAGPERPVARRAYSVEEELDRHIVEYVKSRTPLRPTGERREPTTWVEEKLDRHIVEYMKSRMPIAGTGSRGPSRPPPDEIRSQLTLLRLDEHVKPVKAEGKGRFPEELVKLLDERLKKEESDQ